MVPVYQTRFGKPHGNCVEACIASIMEIPITDIPYSDSPDYDRMRTIAEFVASSGWLYFEMGFKATVVAFAEIGIQYPYLVPQDYYILCGYNEDGIGHAVVARGNEIVHNPNRTEKGILVSVDAYQVLTPCERFDILPVIDQSEEDNEAKKSYNPGT